MWGRPNERSRWPRALGFVVHQNPYVSPERTTRAAVPAGRGALQSPHRRILSRRRWVFVRKDSTAIGYDFAPKVTGILSVKNTAFRHNRLHEKYYPKYWDSVMGSANIKY